MQFTTDVLQSKPPSLEEGPKRCPAQNESCVVYRIEKRGILPKCMEIIKLILLLEVIFFVGWLGTILISNYHLECDRDITAHDSFLNKFHEDEFPVTPNTISNDEIVSSVEDADAISSTEPQISTKPEKTVGFPSLSNNEESYEDNEWPLFKMYPELFDKDIEWPDKINHGKNVLSNPPIDNTDIDIFGEKTESKNGELDPPKVNIILGDDLEDSSMLIPNSGLIHVIENRGYNSNFDSDKKSEVPFPLLKVLGNNKVGGEEKQKLEDDTSAIDSPVNPILEDFEKYVNNPEPDIIDANEDHEFNMKEILFRPEDLDAISKDLHSNDDLVDLGTKSTKEPLDQDEMVLSDAEPRVKGSFDQLLRSTEAKNVVEQGAEKLAEHNVDDDLSDIERQILRMVLDEKKDFY